MHGHCRTTPALESEVAFSPTRSNVGDGLKNLALRFFRQSTGTAFAVRPHLRFWSRNRYSTNFGTQVGRHWCKRCVVKNEFVHFVLPYWIVGLWFSVCRKIGKYVTVSGKTCINVASLNFLGLSGRNDIEVSCSAQLMFVLDVTVQGWSYNVTGVCTSHLCENCICSISKCMSDNFFFCGRKSLPSLCDNCCYWKQWVWCVEKVQSDSLDMLCDLLFTSCSPLSMPIPCNEMAPQVYRSSLGNDLSFHSGVWVKVPAENAFWCVFSQKASVKWWRQLWIQFIMMANHTACVACTQCIRCGRLLQME